MKEVKKVMFKNLLVEMMRGDITKRMIAKELKKSCATIRSRFNGKTQWKENEMFCIRDKYFPDKTIEYLFEKSTT